MKRPLVAGLVLLLAYVGLSLLNDPHGYLGTDTGGKVATLEVMAEGNTLDPDIGYWAQRWDPEGRLHPLWYTGRFDSRWVNVTTLPMLYAALPLYQAGGYRAALLVPMLGAVAAAFAARALARRLGARDGWAAFWLVGLAGPLTVYALDLWEHTTGAALMAWGVVAVLDAVGRRARWWQPVLAGAAFGAAATMRTEALVYLAVAGVVLVAARLGRRRSLPDAAVAGASLVAGVAVPLVLNTLLEMAVLGTPLRPERAAGTAAGAGAGATTRALEAVLTSVGLHPSRAAASLAIGALVVALGAVAVVASRRPQSRAVAVGAAVAVAVLYGLRAATGLGFVPGLLVAAPLAIAGLVIAREGGERRLALVLALVPVPLVWLLQYTGGAAPQWAGRYVLTTGLVLAVLGVVSLPSLPRPTGVALVGLSVAVTAFGVAWLSVRSHDVARTHRVIAERPEEVIVSGVAHLAREGGWSYGDRRWLTAGREEDEALVADVLAGAGARTLAWVDLTGDPPPAIDGFETVSVDALPFIGDVELSVTSYRRHG